MVNSSRWRAVYSSEKDLGGNLRAGPEHVQGSDLRDSQSSCQVRCKQRRLLTNAPIGTGVKIKRNKLMSCLASSEATDLRYTQFLTLTNALINTHIL